MYIVSTALTNGNGGLEHIFRLDTPGRCVLTDIGPLILYVLTADDCQSDLVVDTLEAYDSSRLGAAKNQPSGFVTTSVRDITISLITLQSP
jgi:hypothetical protein